MRWIVFAALLAGCSSLPPPLPPYQQWRNSQTRTIPKGWVNANVPTCAEPENEKVKSGCACVDDLLPNYTTMGDFELASQKKVPWQFLQPFYMVLNYCAWRVNRS